MLSKKSNKQKMNRILVRALKPSAAALTIDDIFSKFGKLSTMSFDDIQIRRMLDERWFNFVIWHSIFGGYLLDTFFHLEIKQENNIK